MKISSKKSNIWVFNSLAHLQLSSIANGLRVELVSGERYLTSQYKDTYGLLLKDGNYANPVSSFDFQVRTVIQLNADSQLVPSRKNILNQDGAYTLPKANGLLENQFIEVSTSVELPDIDPIINTQLSDQITFTIDEDRQTVSMSEIGTNLIFISDGIDRWKVINLGSGGGGGGDFSEGYLVVTGSLEGAKNWAATVGASLTEGTAIFGVDLDASGNGADYFIRINTDITWSDGTGSYPIYHGKNLKPVQRDKANILTEKYLTVTGSATDTKAYGATMGASGVNNSAVFGVSYSGDNAGADKHILIGENHFQFFDGSLYKDIYHAGNLNPVQADQPNIFTNSYFTVTGSLSDTKAWGATIGASGVENTAIFGVSHNGDNAGANSYVEIGSQLKFVTGGMWYSVYHQGNKPTANDVGLGNLSIEVNNRLKVTSDFGYLILAPNSASYCHFYTNLNSYYFNKKVEATDFLKVYGTTTYLGATEGRINNNTIYHTGNLNPYNDGSRYFCVRNGRTWGATMGASSITNVAIFGVANLGGTGGADYFLAVGQAKCQYYDGTYWRDIYHDGNRPPYLSYSGSTKAQATSSGVSVTGTLTASGNVVAYSDARLKSKITPITRPIEKLKKISGNSFYRKDLGKSQNGVIAQEIEKVLPLAIDNTRAYKGVDNMAVTALLIEVCKEQQARIEKLERLLK